MVSSAAGRALVGRVLRVPAHRCGRSGQQSAPLPCEHAQDARESAKIVGIDINTGALSRVPRQAVGLACSQAAHRFSLLFEMLAIYLAYSS
ncbi:MAG TPA: hypothetical protein VGF67_18925 [Ktedonobacteraceae bacterium]|jgi:hypothetical protein